MVQFGGHVEAIRTGDNLEEDLLIDNFPDDFVWGAATAAYQAC